MTLADPLAGLAPPPYLGTPIGASESYIIKRTLKKDILEQNRIRVGLTNPGHEYRDIPNYILPNSHTIFIPGWKTIEEAKEALITWKFETGQYSESYDFQIIKISSKAEEVE